MKKWKNKEHSSLPKSFLERTMFLKMQNSSKCGFLIISTSENKKNVNKISLKIFIFLPFSVRIAFQKATRSVKYETDIHIKCIKWQLEQRKYLWMDN